MDPDTLKEYVNNIGQLVRENHRLNHPLDHYSVCPKEPCVTQKKLEKENSK